MRKQLVTAVIGLTAAGALGATSTAGAAPPAHADHPQAVEFVVTITNISEPGDISVEGAPAAGTVPFSPGVWAVHNGANSPLFREGHTASEGIERVAEDGFVGDEALDGIVLTDGDLLSEARDARRVVSAASFGSGVGSPILPPAVADELGLPEEATVSTFTITARPGQRLSLATMFVQSNDFFLADDGSGIALFDGRTPLDSDDVVDQLVVWDAGTEADTEPGVGPNQKLFQAPDAIDVGPDEDDAPVILPAGETADGFDLPDTSDLLRISIRPVG